MNCIQILKYYGNNKQFSLCLFAFIMFASKHVYADYSFNPNFLSGNPDDVVDLSGFEKGQEVPPGTYRVDIYMNGTFVDSRDVTFESEKNGNLIPCLTYQQIIQMGVNIERQDDDGATIKKCIDITKFIKDATVVFDYGIQKLNITVPQANMRFNARGYIPPSLWDNGIPSLLMNYTFTGNNLTDREGKKSNYNYLNLQTGLNIGAWRIRDKSTWSYTDSGATNKVERKIQHISTYVERAIVPFRSRILIGDGYTSNDIFESLNFRGVNLSSDDSMLPDSQRGFAPVIRGSAYGTAKVSIRQNGFEIYQTTVPPGPFSIVDLYSTGNSGDLQVSVTESDGKTRTWSVPFASVPMLQREGKNKFSLTAGQFRSGTDQQSKPGFIEATFMRGLPLGWTAYTGFQKSVNYSAYNLGIGKNMGFLGAASADITYAKSKLADESNHTGQSVRFLYSKALPETKTNLELAGYRYSSEGYYTLSDTAYNRMNGYSILTQDGLLQIEPKFTDYYNLSYNRKGRIQLNITQQLGDGVSLYINGSQQTYWRTNKKDEQMQLGLTTNIKGANVSLSYNRIKSAWQNEIDNMLYLSLSIPLSLWSNPNSTSAFRNANVSYSVSNDLDGTTTQLAGINGTLLTDNNLNYSIQTGYINASSNSGSSNKGSNLSANLAYRGTYANANGGYSTSNGYKQFYYGLSGGLALHENGLTLGQPLSDTAVLIKAPGAKAVAIQNQTGVKTDWRGYALVPYAMQYRENRIALNMDSLADNVDIDDPVVSVIPTNGALVRADFKTSVGIKAIFKLRYKGQPIPFGASVSGENKTGIVGDEGQVYLTGLPAKGQIKVKWGSGVDKECEFKYNFTREKKVDSILRFETACN